MQYHDPILMKSLNRLAFKLYRSKPFGNCFFNSISKYFRLSSNIRLSGIEIRKNLITYIKNSSFVLEYLQNIGGMSMEKIAEELQELKQSGTYDLDIFDFLPTIIATQYNIRVVIYTWMDGCSTQIGVKDKEIYNPIPDGKPSKKIQLLYSNLEHYDLLYPNK